jgi:hypothetical protein
VALEMASEVEAVKEGVAAVEAAVEGTAAAEVSR